MRNNIFYKMIAIFFIPAMGMILYTGMYTYEKFIYSERLNNMDLIISYVKKSVNLLNELQRERVASSIYISSKGKFFKEKLEKQKNKTDKEKSAFIEFVINNKFKENNTSKLVKSVQKELYTIIDIRNKIIKLNISKNKSYDKYTRITNKIISTLSELVLKNKDKLINKELYSLLYVINAQEFAGQERAKVAQFIYSNQKLKNSEISAISELISFQNYNLEKFEETIDMVDLEFYNSSLSYVINNSVEEARNNLFKDIKENKSISLNTKWWDITTKRINAIDLNVKHFMNKIQKTSNKNKKQIFKDFIFNQLLTFIVLLSLIYSFLRLKKITYKEQLNFTNLTKLKHSYNILSSTNELIIYNYKMQDVLQQACILTTKELGLMCTFVCLVDKNNELKISKFSTKEGLDFTKLIDIEIDNNLYKKAFFEKQNIIIDNIATYKNSTNVSKELGIGIKSIAVYPIYNEELCVGILAFCSQKKHYFDKQIISVFDKMSKDLSYGLKKEKEENLRIKYEEELIIASYAFDSQEAMAITDLDANLVKVNTAFTKITGYSQQEVLGQNPRILKSGRHDKEFFIDMWKDLNENDFWSGELYNKRKNGEIYPERTAITAIKNAKGEITHYIAQFFDISEIKDNQKRLLHELQHDSLTGLNNRGVLEERLTQSIISSKRHNHYGGILFLDLEKFKKINDNFGHHIGDKTLQKVASILKETSRKNDLIVRLGGDEFIILVDNLGSDYKKAILRIEAFANKIIEAIKIPFVIENNKLSTGTSIGISLFPKLNKNMEDIMQHADSAMYLAKKKGKNKVVFSEIELDLINEKEIV